MMLTFTAVFLQKTWHDFSCPSRKNTLPNLQTVPYTVSWLPQGYTILVSSLNASYEAKHIKFNYHTGMHMRIQSEQI